MLLLLYHKLISKSVYLNMAKIIVREAVPNLASSDLDVEALLQQGGEILKREIRNLMIESTGAKLSPASARDLVAYVKLLSELRTEQKDAASELTDEELTALSDSASPTKP